LSSKSYTFNCWQARHEAHCFNAAFSTCCSKLACAKRFYQSFSQTLLIFLQECLCTPLQKGSKDRFMPKGAYDIFATAYAYAFAKGSKDRL